MFVLVDGLFIIIRGLYILHLHFSLINKDKDTEHRNQGLYLFFFVHYCQTTNWHPDKLANFERNHHVYFLNYDLIFDALTEKQTEFRKSTTKKRNKINSIVSNIHYKFKYCIFFFCQQPAWVFITNSIFRKKNFVLFCRDRRLKSKRSIWS